MEQFVEPLAVLGLKPGATWAHINEAYRDLVRIWHPDRFQGNERLLKRAEEQTRLLNDSIAKLRNGYSPTEAHTSPRSKGHESTFTRRPEGSPPVRDHPAEKRPEQPLCEPVEVHLRALGLIGGIALALLVAVVAYPLLTRGDHHPYRAAFACVMFLFATHGTVANSLKLCFPRPLLMIMLGGLWTPKDGLITWPNLHRVWVSGDARSPFLAIEVSPRYLSEQEWYQRTRMSLNHAFRSAHVTVPCRGLDHHPMVIMEAINLHLQVARTATFEQNPLPPVSGSFWARAIAWSAAAVLLAGCLSGIEVSIRDIALYCSLFAVGTGADIGVKLRR